MIADDGAWDYFVKNKVEIFGGKETFDNKSGFIAYSKTIQKQGKANKTRDITDWIVAIGKHEGIISGNDFAKVQTMLDNNKDKGYRKPRSHVALLSGILYCTCGDYMRPKINI